MKQASLHDDAWNEEQVKDEEKSEETSPALEEDAKEGQDSHAPESEPPGEAEEGEAA